MKEYETIAYDSVEDVLLVVHYVLQPAEDEWSSMVKFARSHDKLTALVVFTFGATVTANQRKDMTDLSDEYGQTLCLLTDSRMTRGMLTALSWFGVKVGAYGPDDLGAALSDISRSHLHDTILSTAGESIEKARVAELKRNAAAPAG